MCAVSIAALFLAIGGLPQLLGIRPAHPASLSSNGWTVLRQTPHYLREVVGAFGWDDVRAPAWVVAILDRGRDGVDDGCPHPFRPVPPCTAGLGPRGRALTPALGDTPRSTRWGRTSRGRYLVPVAIGFPLVAATFDWRPPNQWVLPSVVGVLGGLWIAVQTVCFSLTLIRNETGLTAGPPPATKWLPPGGTLPVEFVLVAGGVVTVSLLVVMTRDALPWRTSPIVLQTNAFAARY